MLEKIRARFVRGHIGQVGTFQNIGPGDDGRDHLKPRDIVPRTVDTA